MFSPSCAGFGSAAGVLLLFHLFCAIPTIELGWLEDDVIGRVRAE
jgi:hypothetical protein